MEWRKESSGEGDFARRPAGLPEAQIFVGERTTLVLSGTSRARPYAKPKISI
jgi:hypothetical protein